MKRFSPYKWILPLSMFALVGAMVWLSFTIIATERERIKNDTIIRENEAKKLALDQFENLVTVALEDILIQVFEDFEKQLQIIEPTVRESAVLIRSINQRTPPLTLKPPAVDEAKTFAKLQKSIDNLSSIDQLNLAEHKYGVRSKIENASKTLIAKDIPPESLHHIYQSLYLIWAGVLVALSGIIIYAVRNKKLSETRSIFVSAVTHELRTPITNLTMYAHLLNNSLVPEGKQKHYLTVVEEEALRLQHLIQNVLNYSTIEKKITRFSLEVLPLGEVAKIVQERVAARLQSANMNCQIELPEEIAHTSLIADKTMLEQIIYNLADNAVKYAHTDGGNLIISFHKKNKMACILVSDQGKGIDDRMQKRLFVPFSRSSEMAAGKTPGVGLGLSISRHLAREMNGDLRLDSTSPHGTCFELSLPAA